MKSAVWCTLVQIFQIVLGIEVARRTGSRVVSTLASLWATPQTRHAKSHASRSASNPPHLFEILAGDGLLDESESIRFQRNGQGATSDSIVNIAIRGTAGQELTKFQATVGSDGPWSLVSRDLAVFTDGLVTIEAVATDQAGDQNETKTRKVSKDTTSAIAAVPVKIADDNAIDAVEARSLSIRSVEAGDAAPVEFVFCDSVGRTVIAQAIRFDDGKWRSEEIDVMRCVETDGDAAMSVRAANDAGIESTVVLSASPRVAPPVPKRCGAKGIGS